jgi:hypothetical protein
VADVGRITELWREAADALELEPLHVALQQALLGVRAERAEAECACLREQLDAARQALRAALDCKGSFNGTVSRFGGYPAICAKCADAARAALGVVGGQEQHGE